MFAIAARGGRLLMSGSFAGPGKSGVPSGFFWEDTVHDNVHHA